jgi:Tfp pilus assembly protein PilO
MILNSFFTQIVMVVLALGMLLFYVRPTMSEIGQIQDAISEYKEERSKAESVNAQLAALVSEVNSISAANMKALSTYLPDNVDDAAVMRDISIIADMAEVTLKDISYSRGASEVVYSDEGLAIQSGPVRHDFAASITGEYENIKEFLSLVERSNYPLEVFDFNLNAEGDEDGNSVLASEMVLVTYSHLRDQAQ